jgi:hypothetical protein
VKSTWSSKAAGGCKYLITLGWWMIIAAIEVRSAHFPPPAMLAIVRAGAEYRLNSFGGAAAGAGALKF